MNKCYNGYNNFFWIWDTFDFRDKYRIAKVIFNGPATIVFWKDGSKTVVKCHNDDTYDRTLGFLYACTKRICELNGACKTSNTNKKPFDAWLNAWTTRKAVIYDEPKEFGVEK